MRFEMPDCGGCRTCELACGYHHTADFNPNYSSLHVIDRSDGKPGYYIEINLIDQDDSLGCDGCVELDTPLCVSYCHRDVDLREFIRVVIDEKKRIEMNENRDLQR
jgi:Fe-S-cluster-containing dehydrogenase component